VTHTIGSNPGYWTILLEVDSTSPVEEYATMLEDAGDTIEDRDTNSPDAIGPEWEITFRSAGNGTITIIVVEA
jgi:hypothetical protein